jgi:hypothetical protein
VYTIDEVNAIDSKESSIVESKATMQRMLSWHERCWSRKAIQGDIDEMTALNGDNLKQDYRK